MPLRFCLDAQSLTSSKETLFVTDYLLLGITYAASSSPATHIPSSPLTLLEDTSTYARSSGQLPEQLTSSNFVAKVNMWTTCHVVENGTSAEK